MIEFKELTKQLVLENQAILTDFYYFNMCSCSAYNGLDKEFANLKIMGFADFLSKQQAYGFGAFEQKRLIGYIWSYVFVFRNEKRMYVNELYVDNSYRKKGIGSELLHLVENEARKLGVPSVYIHTEANNINAWHLYESKGFVLERVQLCKKL